MIALLCIILCLLETATGLRTASNEIPFKRTTTGMSTKPGYGAEHQPEAEIKRERWSYEPRLTTIIFSGQIEQSD
ncbi:MAG: hypothetical protein GY696_01215 [Gammaproteobacteria bacterium]|nr:hypothetical protein [Gammaproteobacteria bacterium]